MNRHQRELELAAGEAREAVAEAAEACGAEWTADESSASPAGSSAGSATGSSAGSSGGRLVLPVVYGLRRGVAVGRLEVVRLGDDRSRLEWTLEESHLRVDKSSVAVLSIAVVPLVGAMVSPFWPALFPLVPFAAIFGLLAWWLVVSRLRHFGPEEFLAGIAAAVATGTGAGTRDGAGARESGPPVVR